MRIRRPIATLFTALALFGGGTATLTACGDPAGTDRNDGTTDNSGNDGGGGDGQDGTDQEKDLPDNSDPEKDQNKDGDTMDPD
jgi:hypothetical protein